MEREYPMVQLKFTDSYLIMEDSTKQWGIDLRINLAQLAADFYLLQDTALGLEPYVDKRLGIALGQVTDTLAQQFSRYIDMAIGGELRHAKAEADTEEAELSSRELRFYDALPPLGRSRQDMWQDWKLIRKTQGLDALRLASAIFHKLSWASSWGGDSWGNATDILIQYLSRRKGRDGISKIAFVDTCFGIHHNGGLIFDKAWLLRDLLKVLDYNLANDMKGVEKWASEGAKRTIEQSKMRGKWATV